MADPTDQVQVEGLREVSRALRAISKEAQKELRVGLKDAAEKVAVVARQRTPRRSGKAAASIKARGTNRGASLRGGGPKAPYFPWLDYGGSTKVPGSPARVRRPFESGGRIIYPAIADRKDETREAVEKLIDDLARRHGLDVNP